MTMHVNISGTWRTVTQPYIKTADAWKTAKAAYTRLDNGIWKQVWPADTGTPQIVGLRMGSLGGIYHWPAPTGTNTLGHNFPGVPYYRIIGDRSQIASAYVSVTFDSTVPKEATHVVASWTAPVGWGIYAILTPYVLNPSYPDYYGVRYYYAALTDAEVAAIPSTSEVLELWTPRNGGHFAYMPVCWENSGAYTYPVRSESDGGLDTHTLAGSTPTNTSAVTTKVSDGTATTYTVANGYSDMGYLYDSSSTKPSTTVTIQLKNSGGTVIASTTQTISAPFTDTPGKTPLLAPMMASNTVSLSPTTQERDWYWPVEWNSLFDNFESETQSGINIEFGRNLESGIAEWYVYRSGERIGDFRLAMRAGINDTIEIHGVNLEQTLVGMGIMRTIVRHGTRWSPVRFVVVEPPDSITYDVMRSWGWTRLEEAGSKSKSAFFHRIYSPYATDKFLIYDTYSPMHNRFSELGLPTIEEVQKW